MEDQSAKLPVDARRSLLRWAISCVERVLDLYHDRVPGDDRLDRAIAVGRAFARNEARVPEVREAVQHCTSAARGAGDPIGIQVALACRAALATAIVGERARDVPRHVITAVRLAHPDDPPRAREEAAWQLRALPTRLRPVVYPTRTV
jgi:hypothetical protein